MTRKRFVKLLMGRFGYGRDFANEIAFSGWEWNHI